LAKGTIRFYQNSLKGFTKYLDGQEVKFINQITPNLLRDFLLHLEETGHNSGGIHVFYRSVKVFLRWHWEEAEPEGKNPINKVKAPKNPEKSIQGITREEFDTLLSYALKIHWWEKETKLSSWF